MSDSDRQFSADVKRTIVLGTYIALWGMPATRRVISDADHREEVYFFPAREETGQVNRLATVSTSTGRETGVELLFAWMPTEADDQSDDQLEAFEDLVLDAAVHCQQRGGADPGLEIIPARRPAAMAPTRLVLDEPLTEDESLAQICLGDEHIRVFWLVPLFENETAYLARHGLEAFDALRQGSDRNLFHMDRDSMLE